MNGARVLIAGIGNIFLGDDAFGCEAARRLAGRDLAGRVRVVDFGIRGFDLAFALLDDYDFTILLDAVSRGGRPGTLYRIEPSLEELGASDPATMEIETHGMNPLKSLAMAKSMGARLGRVVLIGCEPLALGGEEDGRMGLSGPVEAALAGAVSMVESQVADFFEENKSDTAAKKGDAHDASE